MSENRIPKFKKGSKVKLNVGGPDMTVFDDTQRGYGEFEGLYRCQWFAGKKLEIGVFSEESLIEVVEEDVKSNES